jgi:hypothetical protein
MSTDKRVTWRGCAGSRSVWSRWSLFSAASILSIGSAGSILSIGSVGSILSIGSAGSVLSIGSSRSILGIACKGRLGGARKREALSVERERRDQYGHHVGTGRAVCL